MDFALSQLINDTGDPRSVIRGHSLARDMYGNDGFTTAICPRSLDRPAVLHHSDRAPTVAGIDDVLHAHHQHRLERFQFLWLQLHSAGSCRSATTARCQRQRRPTYTGTGSVFQTFEITRRQQLQQRHRARPAAVHRLHLGYRERPV